MQKTDGFAILNASQIVTMAGPAGGRRGGEMQDVGLKRGWAMVSRGGKIDWIGSQADVHKYIKPGETVIDASGCSILPGFVDAHTHPVFGGNRLNDFAMRSSGATYQEIASAGGGIWSTVRQTRCSTLEELVAIGEKHARMFLANGTTTIEAKSGYGLDRETELRLLTAIRSMSQLGPLRIVPTFLGAHAVPAEYAGDKSAYMSLVVETMNGVSQGGLAKRCDIFMEDGYFNSADARQLAAAASALGVALTMHVDQFSDSGGAELAAELNAVSADHLEYTSPDGIAALAPAGGTPVLLPASVYCLGLQRYPSARRMIEAGLPVVMATDFNPGSSPTLSMPFVMSLSCTQMGLSLEEALTAATINAACVLGLQGDAGSLEVGKSADFSIWTCTDWREVIYHVGSLRPNRVYCRGVEAG